MEFAVHVFDRRPHDTMPGPVRAAIKTHGAVHTQVETHSTHALVAAATELSGRPETELLAVIPGFEYAVPAAAVVAEKMRLPGLDPAAAEALRDKAQMKKVLSAAGVATATGMSFEVAQSSNEILRYIALELGFPAVVKPVDGSGSLWVTRVNNFDDLRTCVARAAADPLSDMGWSVGTRLMVEKYISGPEFSVEGYVAQGSVTIVSVTEKQLGIEPNFVEVGHIVDADLDAEARAALEQATILSVRALGLTRGLFHLEARLTPYGPVVIEVAARLAGDRIHQLVSLVHGHDLPQIMVRCLAGQYVAAPQVRNAGHVAAIRLFTTVRPGRIAHPASLRRKLSRLTGCHELLLDVTPEANLQPATDFRQRFGHIIVVAPNRRRLDAVLREIDEILLAAIEDVH